MKSKTPRKSPSKKLPVKLKPLLISLLWLVLFIFLVVPTIQKSILQYQLSHRSKSAFDKSLSLAENRHREDQADKQVLLNLGQPVYSAAYDMCYSDHDDSGWFAYNHNFKCQISFLDFYEVPPLENPDKSSIFYDSFNKTIRMWYREYLKEIGRPDYEKAPIDSFEITTDSVTSVDEVLKYNQMLADGVVAYASFDADYNKKLIKESGSRQLNPGKRYAALVFSYPYFKQKLGCAIPKILFCDNPLE
ncbi:MAG: hypothetical protein ACOX0Z_03805 [Candidatus Nanosyncoccaceae bacterium]|jgi:hypothetical protein